MDKKNILIFNSYTNLKIFFANALQWAFSFDTCCILHNNDYKNYPFQQYDFIAATGVEAELIGNATINAFDIIQNFTENHKGKYCFGWMSYDLKNDVEQLSSELPDNVGFPAYYFFVPKNIVLVKNETTTIISNNADEIIAAIHAQKNNAEETEILSVQFQQRTSKLQYISDVEALQQHILNGTIYEINYCQEFFAENISINPVQVFKKLNENNGGSFSSFFKHKKLFALCTSPERFISKQSIKIISQPIKGTMKRSVDEMEDENLKIDLFNNEKERAENVMIVDLVRNDLAKSAILGSVEVPDLFGVYSFKNVHQMISTVTAIAKENISSTEIIKNAFPMGSMTGAPKYTAMQLIEQYEKIKRGLYSGSIGYFAPNGDFDFNVVIRTLLYNEQAKYLSYSTGSAITIDAVAEKEYEECLLKAKALFELFR